MMRTFQFLYSALVVMLWLFAGSEEGMAQQDSMAAVRQWTMAECVAQAKEHSLDAAEAELTYRSAKAQLNSAWWALSPTFSAGASYDLNFGRAIDYGSNTVSNDLQSLNLNVSANLSLFEGLARIHEIKRSQLGLQAAEAQQLAAEQMLTLRVVQAFLDLLYQQDLISARRYQVEALEKQVQLAKTRQAAGQVTMGDVLDMQSQLTTEQQALLEAQNGARAANVVLMQLMNYHEGDSIQIVAPYSVDGDVPLLPAYTTDGLFEEAARDYPTLRAARLSYQQAERGVRIAQAGYMPSLSLNAGYGTGARKFLQENQHMPSDSYSDQLKNNSSVYVGLSLRIPIFDGLATHGRVQQARISAMKSDVATQRASQELYNLVQRSWNDAQSAYKQYQSAKSNVEALRLAAQWAEKKRELGTISSYEYTQTRSKLNVAETTLLQSRFVYMLKLLVLDIYRGAPIEL